MIAGNSEGRVIAMPVGKSRVMVIQKYHEPIVDGVEQFICIFKYSVISAISFCCRPHVSVGEHYYIPCNSRKISNGAVIHGVVELTEERIQLGLKKI